MVVCEGIDRRSYPIRVVRAPLLSSAPVLQWYIRVHLPVVSDEDSMPIRAEGEWKRAEVQQ